MLLKVLMDFMDLFAMTVPETQKKLLIPAPKVSLLNNVLHILNHLTEDGDEFTTNLFRNNHIYERIAANRQSSTTQKSNVNKSNNITTLDADDDNSLFWIPMCKIVATIITILGIIGCVIMGTSGKGITSVTYTLIIGLSYCLIMALLEYMTHMLEK